MKHLPVILFILLIVFIGWGVSYLISKESGREKQCKSLDGVLVGITCFKKGIVYELKD